MSFFDSLVHLPDGSLRPFRPLWRLRLTEAEYEQLKALLAERASLPVTTRSPFAGVERECTLMYAEFWRREYCGGGHSQELIYAVFDASLRHLEAFKEAAKRGMERLRIDFFEQEGFTYYCDSMLYQGGLPLRRICDGEATGVWRRFTQKLLRGLIDLDDPELELGVAARGIAGVRRFAEAMAEAVFKEQPALLPFHCASRTDPRYATLQRMRRAEARRQRERQPFALRWLLATDVRRGRYAIAVKAEGPQKVETDEAEGGTFEVEVRLGEQTVHTYSYIDGFSDEAMSLTRAYTVAGEEAQILKGGEVVAHEALTLDAPLLFARDYSAHRSHRYTLGKKLGRGECAILMPTGSTAEGCDGLERHTLSDARLGARELIVVPDAFRGDIVVHTADGPVTFSSSRPLYWTDIKTNPQPAPSIISPCLYDLATPGSTVFALCYEALDDEGETELQELRTSDVEYCGSGSREWGAAAPVGPLRVRAKWEGAYVLPVEIVNTGGKPVRATVRSHDADSCHITLLWELGSATCLEEGARLSPDGQTWKVARSGQQHPGQARFRLTPSGGLGVAFTVVVRTRFQEVAIVGADGHAIDGLRQKEEEIEEIEERSDSHVESAAHDSVAQAAPPPALIALPFCAFDTWRYRISDCRVALTVGHIKATVMLAGCDQHLGSGDPELRRSPLPAEGSLATLLGGRQKVRSLLGRTAASIVEAELPVTLTYSTPRLGQVRLAFAIKEYPYGLRQRDDGRVVVTDSLGRPSAFAREQVATLLVAKIHHPDDEPRELVANDDGTFSLPAEWVAEPDLLAFAPSPGRVLPRALNATRSVTYADALAGYAQAYMADGVDSPAWREAIAWWRRCCEYGIPASSLWQLQALVRQPVLLVMFALAVMSESRDRETARELLVTRLGHDLAFQWSWLVGLIDGLCAALPEAAAMRRDLVALVSRAWREARRDITPQAQAVIRSLAPSGPEPDDTPDVDGEELDHNQWQSDKEGSTQRFREFYHRANSVNENWLRSRAMAFAHHIDCHLSLFELTEAERRSVIWCYWLYPNRFLYRVAALRRNPTVR